MARPRVVPIAAAAALSAAACGVVARVPTVFGATLGELVPRVGSATWVAAAGALVAAVLAAGPARSRGRLALAAGVGALVALALDGALDVDVARRRGVALAGVGAGFATLVSAGLHASRSTRANLAALGLGAAAIAAIAWADERPTRTSLPALGARAAPPNGAKNLLLITVDTTRRDALGCYGSPRPTTPTLDGLAESSVLFEDATAEAPHTHPAVATLLTSRWPLEHGSVSGAPHLSRSVVTLAEHMRENGYRTAGFLENPWLGPEFGLARGYEHLESRVAQDPIWKWLWRAPDEPFFLHVHFFTPHGPYELRNDALESLGGARAAPAVRRRVGPRVSAQTIRAGEVPARHGFDDEELRWIEDLYASEVREMDAEIAALLGAVDVVAGLDETVVVVAADHGEEFDERGSLHHSHTLYQELVGVPLLVRPAGGVEASRVDVPVGLIDVAPTALELAGLPPLPGSTGRSLAPLARGESLEAAPTIVTERFAHSGGRRLTAIREGRWKLHLRRATTGAVPGEAPLASEIALFDLRADPGERDDRAAEQPERVRRMLAALRAWELAADERVEAEAREATEAAPVSPETEAALRALGYGGG